MSLKEIFKADHFHKLLAVLAGALILVFVFSAGVLVGHEKERFSNRWEKNYYGNIMGPGWRGFNPHSGVGQIIKIEGNNLTVNDRGNVEKTVVVTDRTRIIKNSLAIKLSDLKLDDLIIIIGRPNDQGQIEARLIRVMPSLK